MILSFSTKFKNGNLTHFIKKIWVGLKLVLIDDYSELQDTYNKAQYLKLGSVDQPLFDVNPKIHTIREDKHNRWHAGVLIHFTVFPRSNKMFRFAPVIPCKSVQKIKIEYLFELKTSPLLPVPVSVEVDERTLDANEVQMLAQNDGFDSIDDFFDWFNTDFTGKIIHWTDLKYNDAHECPFCGAGFRKDYEAVEAYKLDISRRYQEKVNVIRNQFPNGIYTKDGDGELVGINVMLSKLIKELLEHERLNQHER